MIKILFPTDYSETANNAFLYALQMCKNYNGELLVLHTYAPNLPNVHLTAYQTEAAAEGKILGAFDLFQVKVKHLRGIAETNDCGSVQIKFQLEEGELVQNIQHILTNEKIDLIVMGTTGNSGFGNKLLGSKTTAVIKNINAPVLSVPHLSKFEGIDAVGFTTLYNQEDAAVIEQMIPYTKNNSADIYCLHVKTKNDEVSKDTVDAFKNKFKEAPVFFIEKESEDVVNAVFNFIDEHSLDMISCITHKKSFLEELFNTSIAQKLANHKNVPLLTYHEDMFK